MIKIQLFGKKDCHLCDLAKEILYRVKKEFPFDLQQIDIESSRDLVRELKDRIPVVFINGRETFVYKINEMRLRRLLRSQSKKGKK